MNDDNDNIINLFGDDDDETDVKGSIISAMKSVSDIENISSFILACEYYDSEQRHDQIKTIDI